MLWLKMKKSIEQSPRADIRPNVSFIGAYLFFHIDESVK